MANYPSALSTNANLYVAVNGLQTTLAVACSNSDVTLTLTSTTGFPTTGLVTIDNTEIVSYTGVSGATITGCVRGADGTTAASHLIGVTVGLTVVAAHHNLLKDEMIAVETALGTNLSNVFPATPTTGSGNVVLATSPTLVTPALGTPSSVVLTSATGLPLTSGVTGTLPNANTTATSSATASAIAARDANSNVKVNTIIENFTTTVTAAGTTVLTAATSPLQQFTGTTTQTVTLPDCTTLSIGFQINILNRSTGTITVNNNGGSLQTSIVNGLQSILTCTNISSANGVWDVSSAAGTGSVTSVTGTANQITVATGTTTPVIAIANPVTFPGAMTAGGALAMAANKITGLANGTVSTDAVAFSQISGFRILQIVSGSTTSNTSTSSTTYVTANLSVTITPASTSSKIFVIVVSQGNAAAATDGNFTLFRNNTTNLGPTPGFMQISAGSSAINITVYDSPATTSATTYTLYMKSDNAAVSANGLNATMSQIFAIEIG